MGFTFPLTSIGFTSRVGEGPYDCITRADSSPILATNARAIPTADITNSFTKGTYVQVKATHGR